MGKILDEELIKVGVEANDNKGIISYGANLLHENGYVNDGYLDAVLKREEEFPTGLLGKGMGIAIPHTNAEYTIKPALCIMIPKEKVVFHRMDIKEDLIDVQVVMMIAVKNGNMELELLKKVAQLLGDAKSLTELKNAKDRAAVVKALSPIFEA